MLFIWPWLPMFPDFLVCFGGFFFVPFGVNFSDFVPMSLVFTVSLNIKIAFLHVGINAQVHSSRAG